MKRKNADAASQLLSKAARVLAGEECFREARRHIRAALESLPREEGQKAVPRPQPTMWEAAILGDIERGRLQPSRALDIVNQMLKTEQDKLKALEKGTDAKDHAVQGASFIPDVQSLLG